MVALLCLAVWLYLVFAHGRFWESGPELPCGLPAEWPEVAVIVPARNEAETIGLVVASLLAQDYAGRFTVTVVDDNSTDATAIRAEQAASRAGHSAKAGIGLDVRRGKPKPAGWSGKLWALSQGIAASTAPVLLFTDADIVHDPRHLSCLVGALTRLRVDMLSEMVRLRCRSLPERALIPAFVYFFQMLYPFSRVNDPKSPTAAAAGGTVLIRRAALERIGGIAAIRDALIDDVTLARAVKSAGPVFLAHSRLAESIRGYPRFRDVWAMIARTAFTQLRYSPLLLLLTTLGMGLIWLVPVWQLATPSHWRVGVGLGTCALAAASYLPTLRRYGQSGLWCLALPLIALFYLAATLGSACSHWSGTGVQWKDRAY